MKLTELINVDIPVLGLRQKLGLSQNEFARLVGVSQSNVARWESGSTHISVQKLKQLAKKAGKCLVIRYT